LTIFLFRQVGFEVELFGHDSSLPLDLSWAT